MYMGSNIVHEDFGCIHFEEKQKEWILYYIRPGTNTITKYKYKSFDNYKTYKEFFNYLDTFDEAKNIILNRIKCDIDNLEDEILKVKSLKEEDL